MKIGTTVKPKKCVAGQQWEEGVYEGVFGDSLLSIKVTKSQDKLVWASCELDNLEVI